MLRAASLTVLLMLIGSPVGQTACLVLCAGACLSSAPAKAAALCFRADSMECTMSADATPALTEESRAQAADPRRTVLVAAIMPNLCRIGADGAGCRTVVMNAHADPPPGLGAAPQVLRI